MPLFGGSSNGSKFFLLFFRANHSGRAGNQQMQRGPSQEYDNDEYSKYCPATHIRSQVQTPELLATAASFPIVALVRSSRNRLNDRSVVNRVPARKMTRCITTDPELRLMEIMMTRRGYPLVTTDCLMARAINSTAALLASMELLSDRLIRGSRPTRGTTLLFADLVSPSVPVCLSAAASPVAVMLSLTEAT